MHLDLEVTFNLFFKLILSMSMFNDCTLAECLPGYHGPLCNMACRYPNYGEECQLQCLCEEEKCDHITGCVLKSSV